MDNDSYLDVLDLDTRRVFSLDSDFADDDDEQFLGLNKRFRGETEDEAFYREAMEMRRGRP